MSSTRTRSGVYGGRSAEQRRAERRGKLLAAATEIWQEQGWAAVTMRGVCARAGLIDRYFYESFADRDALLVAVWDQARDDTFARLLESIADQLDEPPLVQLRVAIAAFVRSIADDPGRAQIFFAEHTGSGVLEQRRQDTLHKATDILSDLAQRFLAPGVDENTFRMTVLMGIGGFIELITAWHAGIIEADVERIIDQAAEFGCHPRRPVPGLDRSCVILNRGIMRVTWANSSAHDGPPHPRRPTSVPGSSHFTRDRTLRKRSLGR